MKIKHYSTQDLKIISEANTDKTPYKNGAQMLTFEEVRAFMHKISPGLIKTGDRFSRLNRDLKKRIPEMSSELRHRFVRVALRFQRPILFKDSIPPQNDKLVETRGPGLETVTTTTESEEGPFFRFNIENVPAEVLARSTWQPQCPVSVQDLSYITVSHWGLDGQVHDGEIIVRREYAFEVSEIFRKLFYEKFPIESLRVSDMAALKPSTDPNAVVSSDGFTCRKVHGTKHWSKHAFGTAIDVNPPKNPLIKGKIVIPKNGVAYVNRSDIREGMLTADSPIVQAFKDRGWKWGGAWKGRVKDYMHFEK